MPWRTLIPGAELARHLSDPDWVVVDCRFDLADRQAGRRAWLAGHLPGAVHLDLERDLSSPVGPDTGRHPLPPLEDFARTLSGIGVSDGTQVVAYDAGSGAFAARLWWLLRHAGHEAVAVLDGGLAAWVAEGRPVEDAAAERPAGRFVARAQPGMLCEAGEIPAAIARGERLVDVRGAERFAGSVEPLDAVAGHVPGAVNLPYLENLGADGRFRAAPSLAALWRERAGVAPGSAVICMCGSGVTACQGLLALEVAGVRGGRLYAGSWSEWIRDPSRPVAVGAA